MARGSRAGRWARAVRPGWSRRGARAAPTSAGQLLLSTYPLWLDASDYVSGTTLTNKGVWGATLNGVISGSPSFAGGAFTFDGVDDQITVPAHVSYQRATSRLTVGIILNVPIAPPSVGAYLTASNAGAAPQWFIRDGGTSDKFQCYLNDTGNAHSVSANDEGGAGFNTSLLGLGKTMIGFLSDRSVAGDFRGYKVRSATLTKSVQSFDSTTDASTAPINIGGAIAGTTNWGKFQFYGMFAVKSIPSDADLLAIAAHYGI